MWSRDLVQSEPKRLFNSEIEFDARTAAERTEADDRLTVPNPHQSAAQTRAVHHSQEEVHDAGRACAVRGRTPGHSGSVRSAQWSAGHGSCSAQDEGVARSIPAAYWQGPSDEILHTQVLYLRYVYLTGLLFPRSLRSCTSWSKYTVAHAWATCN